MAAWFKNWFKKSEQPFNYKNAINRVVTNTADFVGTFVFLFPFGFILDGLQFFLKKFFSYPNELKVFQEALDSPNINIVKVKLALEIITNTLRHCFIIAGVGLGLILALVLMPIFYITGMGGSKDGEYALWELVVGRPEESGKENSPLTLIDRKLYLAKLYSQYQFLWLVSALSIFIYFKSSHISLGMIGSICAIGSSAAFLGLLVGMLEALNILTYFLKKSNTKTVTLFNITTTVVQDFLREKKHTSLNASLLPGQTQATLEQFQGHGLFVYLSDELSKFREEFRRTSSLQELQHGILEIESESGRSVVSEEEMDTSPGQDRSQSFSHSNTKMNFRQRSGTFSSFSPPTLQHAATEVCTSDKDRSRSKFKLETETKIESESIKKIKSKHRSNSNSNSSASSNSLSIFTTYVKKKMSI